MKIFINNNQPVSSCFILILFGFFSIHVFAQDSNKAAIKLYEKINGFYEDYDYKKILEAEEKIIETVAGRGDTLEAVFYSFLGEAYFQSVRDYQKALEYYEKNAAITVEVKGNDHPDLPYQMKNIGFIQLSLGNYNQALSAYQRGMDYYANNKDKTGLDYALFVTEFAGILTDLRQFNRAEDIIEQASKEFRGKDHRYEAANLTTALAYNYLWSGRFSRAIQHYEEALELFEETVGKATYDYLGTAISLSDAYIDRARIQDAETLLLVVLSVYDELEAPDDIFYASILNQLGRVYTKLGNYDGAIEAYKEDAEIRKNILGEETVDYAISLVNLSYVYYKSGFVERCITLADQALDIFELQEYNTSDLYTEILKIKALALAKLQRLDEAKDLIAQDIIVKEQLLGENHSEIATTKSVLADIEAKLGNKQNALNTYEAALKIRRSKLGKKHPYYAQTTRELAGMYWESNNLKKAYDLYIETFENYFSQIDNYFPVLSENEKALFFSNNLKPTFEEFNSYALTVVDDNPKILADVYDYQLATKGLIFYATNKVRESIFNSGDSALMAKYRQWVDSKERLSKLFSLSIEELDEQGVDLDSLVDASNQLEKELSMKSAVFAESYVRSKLTWKDVQQKLKEDEAAIEMIRFRKFEPDSGGYLTNTIYYAALIVKHDTKDHPELVIFENGRLLEKRYLANYRNAIKFKIKDNFSYEFFWKPIEEQLNGIKKVFFSPDGVYNQISLATLHKKDGDVFLIDEYDIQILTNTKDLITLSRKEKNREGRAYLFGFPNYNKGLDNDPSLLAGAETRSSTRGRFDQVRGGFSSATTESNTRSIRGSGLSRGLRGSLRNLIRGGGISMLPGTKKEIEYIAQLYEDRNLEFDTLLLDNAIEENIKTISNPKTLHIATHGFFVEDLEIPEGEEAEYLENPLLRSGLILAGANKLLLPDLDTTAIASEDGILTAYEAMNLNLNNTELVILSACETGLGEVKNGEGVYGLQRAFMVAGAKSLIMSLWSVDDEATQELMNLFYENWLESNNRQASFQKAQRVLKQKYPEPFYWGAFVMVGI